MAGKYNYHHQHKEASDTCISTKKTALNTEPSTMQLTNATLKKSYIKYNSPSKKTITKLMQQQKKHAEQTVLFHGNGTLFYEIQKQRLHIFRNITTDFHTAFIRRLVKICYFSPNKNIQEPLHLGF